MNLPPPKKTGKDCRKADPAYNTMKCTPNPKVASVPKARSIPSDIMSMMDGQKRDRKQLNYTCNTSHGHYYRYYSKPIRSQTGLIYATMSDTLKSVRKDCSNELSE